MAPPGKKARSAPKIGKKSGVSAWATEVLRAEAEVLLRLQRSLPRGFAGVVEQLRRCRGRVAVIGIGKSGLIARKIAATFSATGTPAFFLHPSETIHGDLGMLSSQDLPLILSYSGETEEIHRLLPHLRRKVRILLAMTGNSRSRLAREASLALILPRLREACPYNLTPTTSTTAMLALGDALAIVLMRKRGVRTQELARLHPGGVLGKRLLLRVSEIMHRGEENPIVSEGSLVRQALFAMTQSRLGATNIVNSRGILVGFFTDGDLRRKLQKDPQLLHRRISRVMTIHPITLRPEQLASEAAEIIQKYRVDNIPVVDSRGRPIGILDERDLISEGLV
ncbi:MAG: KpsF/GutQ family sugar-phosphate isomerase [Elusimicrobia bacterium]|nr:KpsF/GutQ family sugar-phosphate isomerase [Elusimicrobiota bacterium]